MKVTLEFDSIDDRDELRDAQKGSEYACALHDIANDVFRPHRKHGYPDEELRQLCENEDVLNAIALLEKKFYAVLSEWDITI